MHIVCNLFAFSLYKVCLSIPLVPVCLLAVCSMSACFNYEQVLMDYVLFIPPPPFFEGTRAEFDTTLVDYW